VLWGPNPGQVQELPPLPGDTVGFALALNNSGQAVGGSGTCANTVVVPFALAPHAVLWDHGSPISLGNLGGTMVAVAAGINDTGQVDGAADLASEIPGFPGVQIHGFVWTQSTGMQDIGTVGTDFSSIPEQINNTGQMVGASCDAMGNCRAFLWQNKVMVDLNSLIPANSLLYLMWAFAINEEGVIAGMASDTTGDVHAFLATPNQTVAADSLAPAVQSEIRLMPFSENARKLLRRRVGMIGW
jgi:probable HAF family extracellular repeat protein